jgi:hypothetical protein
MKQVARLDIIEHFGGEQAHAEVSYESSIIQLELWQDRTREEQPYVIWLGSEAAEALSKALLDASQRAQV